MAKRNFFSKKNLIRKCLICKGPNPPRENDHMYCEVCLTKRCCVCRKIKLFQVRLVLINGSELPICPRHFGSYQRFRTNSLNLKWLADEEFKAFEEKMRMDKLQAIAQEKIARGEVIPDSENPESPDVDAIVEEMFRNQK